MQRKKLTLNWDLAKWLSEKHVIDRAYYRLNTSVQLTVQCQIIYPNYCYVTSNFKKYHFTIKKVTMMHSILIIDGIGNQKKIDFFLISYQSINKIFQKPHFWKNNLRFFRNYKRWHVFSSRFKLQICRRMVW